MSREIFLGSTEDEFLNFVRMIPYMLKEVMGNDDVSNFVVSTKRFAHHRWHPRLIAFALYFPDYFPSTESTCMGIKYRSVLGLGDLFFAAIICEYIFVFELVTRKESQRKDPPCSSTYEPFYCSKPNVVSLLPANLTL